MTRRLLLLLAPLCLFAQKKPVTIDAAASGGRDFGGGRVLWAPDGRHFAVWEGDKISLVDAATAEKKDLADAAPLKKMAVEAKAKRGFDFENRHVAEERLQWSPDGTSLLAVSGGDIFVYAIDAKQWTQLTATADTERDQRMSPDGKSVAFLRNDDLWLVDIASKNETRLTTGATATLWNGRTDWVYPEELSLGNAYWWSPDSKRIAYLQFDVSKVILQPQVDLIALRAVYEPQRYPKAGTPNADVRLGVVAATGGETKWMDLGVLKDKLLARVNWNQDGSAVFVQKMNRVQNHLELLAANPASGAAKLILEEKDPYWVNINDALRFLDNGDFLWASERTGFRHLYLYSGDGKLKRALTSGEWEISQIEAIDAKSRRVYYTSTEASPLERQLYAVSLDGGARQRLTQEKGTHAVSVSPGGAYFLDSFSSRTQPTRRTLHSGPDGREVAVYRAADTKVQEQFDLLPIEIVEVRAEDGGLMYARLIKPAQFDAAKKYPAIVMVYGGPHVQSVRDSWAGANLDQALAHRGFVIWQLDNRGSAGRGHKWESKLFRRMGMQELEDQRRGVEHLVSMGFVDGKRIGIHGGSYGGFMTLYALMNAPDTFQAGVAAAPVTDWRNYDTIYTERYMGLPGENNDGYKKSSPVNLAENLRGRLMITHNIEDDNVFFQNSMQMMDALQQAGKQYETVIYPQKSHGVTGVARKHMYNAIADFFERSLR